MSPNVNIRNLPGFGIPEFDSVEIAYVGATNNLASVIYKRSTTTVATLTFGYTGTPSSDDANVVSVTRS